MRWRRVAGAFPWRTAALLAAFAALEGLCWWTWHARELLPLERYYLLAYFRSMEHAKHPGTKAGIEPLYLTAPGRKPEIVIAEDVTAGRTGEFSLRLSESARARGWTGIGKGRQIWDDAAAVEEFLRETYYQDRGFWQLAAEPLAESCALMLVVLYAAFTMRAELAAEWRCVWVAATEPEEPRYYEGDSPPNRSSSTGRFAFAWDISKWVQKLRSKLGKFGFQKNRAIHAERGPINDASSIIPAELSIPSAPPDSSRLQQPKANPLRTRHEPANDSAKRPAKRRRIFPGKAGVQATGKQPKPWDESQWID